jgi:hypothetical protein
MFVLVKFIILNAFQPNQFISYFGKVSLLNQGPESLLERLDVYQQQRVNRANLPAEMKQTTPTTVKTWRIKPQMPKSVASGTPKQMQPEGRGDNATTETKKIGAEAKTVPAAVVVGLAVGRAVM